MSLAFFLKLLKDPSPAFECYYAGDKLEKLSLIAKVINRLGVPATVEDVRLAKELSLNVSKDFISLIKLHNGVELFCDERSDAVGIEFYRVQDWERMTEELHSSLSEMSHEEGDLDWAKNLLAFGEIPHSGNYFAIQTQGDLAGSIYYVDHDDYRTEPFVDSFDELMGKIASDPPQFMYDRGCYIATLTAKQNNSGFRKITSAIIPPNDFHAQTFSLR